MLRLDPGGRREKGQTGGYRLEVFIVDYSSVKCVKRAFAEQAAWGEFYWLTGNQCDAAQLFTHRTCVQ